MWTFYIFPIKKCIYLKFRVISWNCIEDLEILVSTVSKHTPVCSPSVMCIRHIGKEAATDTRGQVSLFCAEPPFSVQTDRADISCVFSLGQNSSLSVSVSSSNSTGWDLQWRDNAYHTPTTCHLSFVLWCAKAPSPSSWSIHHASIHRLCCPHLTLQVSYVQFT